MFRDLDYELDIAEMSFLCLFFLACTTIHNIILRAKENTIRGGLYCLFMKELKSLGERACFAIS